MHEGPSRRESNLPVRRISPARDAFAAELTFPGFRKVGRGRRKSRVGKRKSLRDEAWRVGGPGRSGLWRIAPRLVEIPIGLVENRSQACGDFHQACGLARGGSARNSIPVDSRRFPSTRLQVGPARASLYRLGVELNLSLS